MSSILSRSTFFDDSVPPHWEPVLLKLDKFMAAQKKVDAERNETNLAELRACHDELVTHSTDLLDPQSLDHMDESELHRLFAFSILTASWFHPAAVGSGLIDTAGSTTVESLQADFRPNEKNADELRALILDRLNITENDFNAIESKLYRALADMRTKHKVIRGITQHFGLDNPTNRPARVHRFFKYLYPAMPLREGDVEIVVSGVQIFFILPFEKDKWKLTYLDELSQQERAELDAFLDKFNNFQQHYLEFFPVFTDLDTTGLDREVTKGILEWAEVPQGVFLEELKRIMITVPKIDIEKYLVHDVWGHSWQASVLFFDDIYRKVARYGEPLEFRPSDNNIFGAGIHFIDCFDEQQGFQLNEPLFHRFVKGKIAERLPLAFTPAVAELIADIMEYKFIAKNPQRAKEMPSSSAFKDRPSKLDLMLQDLSLYFEHTSNLFTSWANQSEAQDRQVATLCEMGAEPAIAKQAVARAVELWREYELGFFASTIRWHKDDAGNLHVNAVARLALNFIGIHREVLRTMERMNEMTSATLPLNGFHDLQAAATCVFFEADRARHFWHLDEFLAQKFIPLCARFGFE